MKLALANGANAVPADLLNQPLADAKAATGELSLKVAPYQVRSVKFTR